MSDLELRSGRRVAVDTATLREAADGFDRLVAELSEAQRVVAAARTALLEVRGGEDAAASVSDVLHRVLRAYGRGEALGLKLRAVAAMYDLSELEAQRAASGGDPAGAVDRRIALLRDDLAAYSALDPRGAARLGEWSDGGFWAGELVRQAMLGWPVGTLGLGILGSLAAGAATSSVWALVRARGLGRVGPGDRLTGPAKPVSVRAIAPAAAAQTPVQAPTSLAGALTRIPYGGEGRIRVEQYRMPDGSRQYVAYITGTVDWSVAGGDEPFDAESDLELYGGERSASYEAVREALRQSGARPGDTVHAVGHSQGGMIASYLATEGEFDVGTVITAGSPVEADVDPGTLSVQLRHSDDIVSALAGGGADHALGAPGSFTAVGVGDSATGLHDVRVPAHRLDGYLETARQVDASTDPRVDGVRALFAELARADAVSATTYGATRVSPSSAAAAG